MKPYVCYIHRPTRSIADLTVIACEPRELPARLDALTREWDDFVRIDVYDGDRRVAARHSEKGAAWA